MFHARLNDLEIGKELCSIAMVTSEVAKTSSVSKGLVSQFSEELFLTDEQRKAFQATQVYLLGEVLTNTDKYTNMALLYLYRKATEEVRQFNSRAVVERIGVEVDGVLLSSGRILDEMEFLQTA